MRAKCRRLVPGLLLVLLLGPLSSAGPEDPLASWREGPAKQAVRDFVRRVTTQGSPEYKEPAERVAVFDNDGTLWSEQPMYFQLMFALDRIALLAPEHPEWKQDETLRGILEKDETVLSKLTEEDIVRVVGLTHSGMTVGAFRAIVADWLDTKRHPRFDRRLSELTYAPMTELLRYLRAHGFSTWICSGGGVDFMRVFAEKLYGIPPEQVIGSEGEYRFDVSEGRAVLVKLPGVARVNDKGGKPVGIELRIGRRPILAGGNSDGDLAMIRHTAQGGQPYLGLLVHHDDAEREWAYDRKSHVGRLDKALVEAASSGWTVVGMKRAWRRVYAFQELSD